MFTLKFTFANAYLSLVSTVSLCSVRLIGRFASFPCCLRFPAYIFHHQAASQNRTSEHSKTPKTPRQLTPGDLQTLSHIESLSLSQRDSSVFARARTLLQAPSTANRRVRRFVVAVVAMFGLFICSHGPRIFICCLRPARRLCEGDGQEECLWQAAPGDSGSDEAERLAGSTQPHCRKRVRMCGHASLR